MRMDFDIKPSKLKSRRQTETLHKPIENVKELLETIKKFNYDFIPVLCSYVLLFIKTASRN